MSHRLPSQILLFLVLLGMGWAQLLGVTPVYAALVDGQWVETKASHHHACDGVEEGHFVCYQPHTHVSDETVEQEHRLAYGHACGFEEVDPTACGSSPVRPHEPMVKELQLQSFASVSWHFQAPLVAILEPWQRQDLLGLVALRDMIPMLESFDLLVSGMSRGESSPVKQGVVMQL